MAPIVGAQTGATAYPNKPIRLLVGYGAGGGVDAMARMLAVRLSPLLGQQVVVENRAGASGVIAADIVSKSPADGYTLLMGESALLIAPHLQPRASFDPLKSLTHVAGVFVAPLMIVTGNGIPAKTPEELIRLLKSNPGKYSYATSGVGTVQHLGFEMFKSRTGTFVLHIPYRGAAQIVPDVISGVVPIGVVSASAAMAQARSGRLNAVAIMNTGKLAGAEDVPALAQALPGFNLAPRLFLAAPSGTPTAILTKLNDAVRTVLASADLAQAAALQGAIPAYTEPGPLAADLVRESAEWANIIKTQKIKAE
ncbi:MAG: tripartite tricarboxylate transporter substrate-binding protein [Ramlibacter sp.]